MERIIEYAEKSFATYRNYLLSFALFIENSYGIDESLFRSLKRDLEQRSGFKRIEKKDLDGNRIKVIQKLLFNAWNTDYLISFPESETDLKKYSNHWLPVQLYYSLYLKILSFLHSMNRSDIPGDHTSTLKTISNIIVNRNIFPGLWNIYCYGCVQLKKHDYGNLPDNVSISDVHNLSNPRKSNPWNWYAKWLKTTRQRDFDRKAEKWKKEKKNRTKKGKKRKRLNREHKIEIDSRIHETTFFDCIYRLRVRSNYQDADAYLFGSSSEKGSEEYYDSLLLIGEATSFILEFITRNYIGDDFKKLLMDFLKSIDYSDNHPLKKRKPYLL